MIQTRSLVPLAFAATVMTLTAAPGLAKGGTAPSLQISPSRLTIGKQATFHAAHLKSSTYVTLLMLVPASAKHPDERLLGLTRTNDAGQMRVTVRIPAVTHCGTARIYLMVVPNRIMANRRITLDGCKASSKTISPPPPPSVPKKTKPHGKKP